MPYKLVISRITEFILVLSQILMLPMITSGLVQDSLEILVRIHPEAVPSMMIVE